MCIRDSSNLWQAYRNNLQLLNLERQMCIRDSTPVDVKNAVDNENVELPSGSIMAHPYPMPNT